MVKYFYNQENNEVSFKIEVVRNIFTCKTTIGVTGPESKYVCNLKVGEEKDVINNMIWSIGQNATYEEARDYFRNHKERM